MLGFVKRCLPAVVGTAAFSASMLTSAAFGGGFEVPMQGARAAGQADAFIAQANDPSAVFYNPAGLTQIDGTQVMVGALGLFPQWRFEADNGPDQSMYHHAILPHFYVSSDLGTERWRVGFGVNNVFGISEDWGPTGPLRTVVDEAKLMVLNFSPAVAYQVDDHLSLGVALNVYYGDIDLDRKAVLGPPPFPEGSFHLEGHDWAVGVTPSLLWKIDDRNQIGAYYRSPVTLDLNGTAEVVIPGAPDISPQRSNLPINLPQSIGLGYAMRPIKPLKIEADIIWTDWNSLDRIRIGSTSPVFNNSRLPADWRSGFTYRLGTEYALNENWMLRAGYAYSDNAIPNATFTPIVPDSEYHLFALGAGYTRGQWNLDLAYQLIYREDRDIRNSTLSPTIDGHWENTIHNVMLSATYRF